MFNSNKRYLDGKELASLAERKAFLWEKRQSLEALRIQVLAVSKRLYFSEAADRDATLKGFANAIIAYFSPMEENWAAAQELDAGLGLTPSTELLKIMEEQAFTDEIARMIQRLVVRWEGVCAAYAEIYIKVSVK